RSTGGDRMASASGWHSSRPPRPSHFAAFFGGAKTCWLYAATRQGALGRPASAKSAPPDSPLPAGLSPPEPPLTPPPRPPTPPARLPHRASAGAAGRDASPQPRRPARRDRQRGKMPLRSTPDADAAAVLARCLAPINGRRPDGFGFGVALEQTAATVSFRGIF